MRDAVRESQSDYREFLLNRRDVTRNRFFSNVVVDRGAVFWQWDRDNVKHNGMVIGKLH